MKNSEEYIIKQLGYMITRFPFLKLRYEFEPIGECHYIEVLPSSTYHNDKEYIKFETNLEDNFCKYFEGEDICFLTEGSLFEINNPVYENEGVCYGNNTDTQVPDIFGGYKLNFPTKVGFWENGVNFNFSNNKFEEVSVFKTSGNESVQQSQYTEGIFNIAA